MEELTEEICQQFESGHIDLQIISPQLHALTKKLTKATSRFVDIDPSVKDDFFLFQKVRNDLVASFQDEKLQEDLFNIYETLKTYLALKFKYGEAADWYLKNEFDSHLEAKIKQALAIGRPE